MALNTYALVNPMIVGTMKTTVDAPSSSAAAVEIYNRLSPFFSNVQSNFVFTIQKLKKDNKQVGGGSDNAYTSYRVKEVEKDGEAVFVISTYSGNIKLNNLKNSINRVQERLSSGIDLVTSEQLPTKQDGGKKKHLKQKHTYEEDEDDDDVFDSLMDELEKEDSNMFPKKRNNMSVLSSGVNYITELAVPVLVDPIEVYVYNPIYEINKIVLPSFISTVTPKFIIDFGFLDSK